MYALFPVAPPRLAELGLVDTVSQPAAVDLTGRSTIFYNPLAAVPSLHVGFALALGVALALALRSRWTKAALALLWGPLVALAVVATASHYVFDIVAGVAVTALGFAASRLPARLGAKPRRVAGAETPSRVMPDPLRTPSALLGSVLLGAASGMRAQIGLAILVARQDPSLPPFLQQPWTRRLLAAAAAGELVMDKLPSTPSRLVPPAIASRLALGVLAASLLARTRRAPLPPAAVIGGSSAAVAAKFGHDVRARLARTVPDPAIAVVEDALAVELAALATSR